MGILIGPEVNISKEDHIKREFGANAATIIRRYCRRVAITLLKTFQNLFTNTGIHPPPLAAQVL